MHVGEYNDVVLKHMLAIDMYMLIICVDVFVFKASIGERWQAGK